MLGNQTGMWKSGLVQLPIWSRNPTIRPATWKLIIHFCPHYLFSHLDFRGWAKVNRLRLHNRSRWSQKTIQLIWMWMKIVKRMKWECQVKIRTSKMAETRWMKRRQREFLSCFEAIREKALKNALNERLWSFSKKTQAFLIQHFSVVCFSLSHRTLSAIVKTTTLPTQTNLLRMARSTVSATTIRKAELSSVHQATKAQP